ncbi:MAG TPA: signal peptide peptidase SppA [Myxococcota bacterium]|nr:signal peptide peptidase SppA [Myxococcota bacterium]
MQVPHPPPPPRISGTRILLGITVVTLGMLGVAGGAIWYALNRVDEGEVDDGSYLQVTLDGPIAETPSSPGLFDKPDDFPPTLTEVAGAIRHAATDERIKGLYLDISGPAMGWASWQELRDAVLEFSKADKPCVAYVDGMLGNGSYYLASACEKIVLSPGGAVLFNGLQVELTYYKGTFDKLGITPEFEHVGDFKSFIEVYERTEPSESAAQAYDTLLDSLYAQLIDGVATGRKVTPEVVRGWVDQPSMTPRGALERGMVDALAWPDGLRAHFMESRSEGWVASLDAPVATKHKDDDDDGLTPLSEYVKAMRARESQGSAAIAVIYAEGDIVSGGDGDGGLFGDDGMLTDTEFAGWMRDAREDDDVKAVVVRVNSRGGSGEAASVMLRQVARMHAAGKPVVISMGDAAASGGYMLACQADHIVAQPGTLTGSIGVFGGKFDVSGTYDKIGFSKHTFKRGELSDLLSFTAPFSDAGRAVFRGYLEDFYKVFVDDVAAGRHRSYDEIHAVAQGRVWTGSQALERGLVDQLGGLDVAVAKAAELASVSEFRVEKLPRRRTFIEAVMEDLEKAEAPVFDVTAGLPDGVRAELGVLERVARDGTVAVALLPGAPELR